MKLLINPYSGYSDELARSVEKFGGSLEKPKCKDGLCPIPQPVKLLQKKKIQALIDIHKGTKTPINITIICLNEKDQLYLSKMSRLEGWGTIENLNIKIICEM